MWSAHILIILLHCDKKIGSKALIVFWFYTNKIVYVFILFRCNMMMFKKSFLKNLC